MTTAHPHDALVMTDADTADDVTTTAVEIVAMVEAPATLPEIHMEETASGAEVIEVTEAIASATTLMEADMVAVVVAHALTDMLLDLAMIATLVEHAVLVVGVMLTMAEAEKSVVDHRLANLMAAAAKHHHPVSLTAAAAVVEASKTVVVMTGTSVDERPR